MFELFDWMPERASEWAGQVDGINNLITNIAVVCILLITGAMLVFAFLYRRRAELDDKASNGEFITHNAGLEAVWTIIPSVVCVLVFFLGFKSYRETRLPPSNAMEIRVNAYASWSWGFTYPNGKKTSNELIVPFGKPVRLIMTSDKVIHSFFVPALRLKEDVYAGNYSYLWFTPDKMGEFHIFCAEYCGLKHSSMRGVLKVVSQQAFDDFLLDRQAGGAPTLSPAEKGKRVFKNMACAQCHSIDGSSGDGPSLKNVYGEGKRTLNDNSKVEVDENYLRESILKPAAKVVQGYQPLMPSFEGRMSEEELADLIEYLKTL